MQDLERSNASCNIGSFSSLRERIRLPVTRCQREEHSKQQTNSGKPPSIKSKSKSADPRTRLRSINDEMVYESYRYSDAHKYR